MDFDLRQGKFINICFKIQLKYIHIIIHTEKCKLSYSYCIIYMVGNKLLLITNYLIIN